MARARCTSIGLSGSLSASMVSNRWLRRSVILFFIDFPYLALERGSESDDLGQLWRIVVNRIATHQLSTRDEFEVVEVEVRLVAVSEGDGKAFRHWPVGLLPDQDVFANPVPGRIASVGDLALQVSVFGEASRSDWFPGVRLRTGFELRLRHSARSPAGTAKALVSGDVAGQEP